jgi:hypothetical protein
MRHEEQHHLVLEPDVPVRARQGRTYRSPGSSCPLRARTGTHLVTVRAAPSKHRVGRALPLVWEPDRGFLGTLAGQVRAETSRAAVPSRRPMFGS